VTGEIPGKKVECSVTAEIPGKMVEWEFPNLRGKILIHRKGYRGHLAEASGNSEDFPGGGPHKAGEGGKAQQNHHVEHGQGQTVQEGPLQSAEAELHMEAEP